MSRIWPILLALALGACGAAQTKSEADLLEATLSGYADAMRWGDVEEAIGYIDPKLLEEHPISSLEIERFRQLQVAGYREQPAIMLDETHASQIVQIEVINRHTQAVRGIVDRQQWRLDREAKRWWLVSGLPQFAEDY